MPLSHHCTILQDSLSRDLFADTNQCHMTVTVKQMQDVYIDNALYYRSWAVPTIAWNVILQSMSAQGHLAL